MKGGGGKNLSLKVPSEKKRMEARKGGGRTSKEGCGQPASLRERERSVQQQEKREVLQEKVEKGTQPPAERKKRAYFCGGGGKWGTKKKTEKKRNSKREGGGELSAGEKEIPSL